MVIAVDFDGTIVEHRYPEIGDERPFAVETLKKLAEHRHKLVLWTMREGQLLDDALGEGVAQRYVLQTDIAAVLNVTIRGDVRTSICSRAVGDEFLENIQLEEPPAPKWMFWKSNRSRH